jgi:hypothetical protein
MCIDAALHHIENTVEYFGNYRNEGFASSLIIAKEIPSHMGVQPSFPVKRRTSRKKQFDESDSDSEEVNLEAEKAFEASYFFGYGRYGNQFKLDLKNLNHSKVNLAF